MLYDLGYPPALAYMTAYLTSSVKAFELDVLRMDFNMDPAGSWALKDAQTAAARAAGGEQPPPAVQTGMAEVAHVTGLYSMWAAVVEANPGLLLDNCASGGRRLDLETATLSVPLWQSDMAGNRGDVSESWQSQAMGLSAFLPIHSGGCPRFDSHTTSGPTGERGLTTEVEPYVWRSCGSVGKAIAWTPAMWAALAANATMAAAVRTAVAETQRLRSIVAHPDAAYYPLTPVTPAHPWAAYQHQLNDTGFVVVFNRPTADPDRPRLIRAVANLTDYQWALTTTPGGRPGYYQGVYSTDTPNITAFEQCKAACAASSVCTGFTFVPEGGPPCALYSAITGPFTANSRVLQYAKLYGCPVPGPGRSCIFGLDRTGKRHAVPAVPGAPFLESCQHTYVPNCAPPLCEELLAAPDGDAGCPPYGPGGGGAGEFELKLRGLRAQGRYNVSVFNESYAATDVVTMTGQALASWTVAMPARSSLLIWIAPL